MAKILAMTGAAGKKSGGYFSRILSENLEEVSRMFPDGIRFLTRPGSDKDELWELIPQLEFFEGRMRDRDLLRNFFEGVDTFVHIAGINYSLDLVEAAAECNVRRVILVHTTGAYSKHKSAGEAYRKIDEQVSQLCKEKGIVLTICRPTMIYGNIHDNNVINFIKMVDRYPVMPVVNGARYALQPVHYKDLSKAYFDILMNEEKTANRDYILSGGAPIELREMLLVIGEQLGKKVRFVSCPFFLAYFGACVIYWLSFHRKDYREKVQRLCEPRVFSFEDAARDFGYAPVTFAAGVREEITQYQSMK